MDNHMNSVSRSVEDEQSGFNVEARVSIPNHRRILLIDDTAAIHDDFRKILMQRSSEPELEALEAALLGEEKPRDTVRFDIDSAYQGQEGVARVQEALAADSPYALAFVDMRMPPGW